MIRVYIGLGQSNMDGRGVVSEAPAYTNGSRLYCYYKDSTLGLAVEPVTDSSGCTYTIMNDSDSAIGPLGFFGDKMATHFSSDTILIVPCCKGSTAINVWRRLPTTGNLWGATMARVAEAIEAAKAQWPTEEVKLCGLLFWQGEGDSTTSANATTWREDFGDWVAEFRTDIGDLDLPIVFYRLNNLSHPNHAYWTTVRNAMTGVYIRNVGMANIDSPTVQYKSDAVHATTAGQVNCGHIAADVMYALET
jgi:hypothetical protein